MNKETVTILSFAIFIITFIGLVPLFTYETATGKKIFTETKVVEEVIPPINPFSGISVEGEAAYVVDLLTNEELYSKNANSALPLASITKVMTAITAREIIPKNATITIDINAIGLEGDNGLFQDEIWPRDELLALTLVSSSNDGARAIRNTLDREYDSDLVTEMNKKSTELGTEHMYFLNESGLDVAKTVGGAYGSATDVSKILKYALEKHYDLFRHTQESSLDIESLNYTGVHSVDNTNKIINEIPSLVLSKTGFTDLAGGNLGIIFEKEPNHPVAVVVLGSTEDERFSDIKKLVDAAIEK